MILYHKRNMPDMQVRTLAFIGDASGGISDEKNNIFFVPYLTLAESHNYKNLFLYTKMRNVAGIAQTEAQKSSDMFAKCQYLDEITSGKGVTFATGTPISNSMTELYTNMRYLQYGTLQKLGLGHFDSWAASFGETQTAIDIACQL